MFVCLFELLFCQSWLSFPSLWCWLMCSTFSWELTCNGKVFVPTRRSQRLSFAFTETWEKWRLPWIFQPRKEFNFSDFLRFCARHIICLIYCFKTFFGIKAISKWEKNIYDSFPKGAFQFHVKIPPLFQLGIPTGRRHTIWLFKKRFFTSEFAPGITEYKFIQ